ncbi:MAG: hypothetical protein LBS16_03355 [Prevotellaceae bacterium]|jgi:hypothetical protein|nr:hypothetical protein [Prevotellaceae bacterium]
MKNIGHIVLMVLCLASLGISAQTVLQFSGNRTQIATTGIYYVPQQVYRTYAGQDICIDIVKDLTGATPRVGFEGNTTGLWSPQSASWWSGNSVEIHKQYVDLDVQGTYSYTYGGSTTRVIVRHIGKADLPTHVATEPSPLLISSFDGCLNVKSEERIASIEVYSSIGGLLHRSVVDNFDVRITNLPKTILVIRVTVGSRQIVQKVKML